MNITDISGIGNATARLLKTHGIASVEAVAQASIEQLVAVPGIGESRAAALRESARRLLSDAFAGAESPEAVSTPADDAEVMLFLCAGAAYVTGHTLVVTGGSMM